MKQSKRLSLEADLGLLQYARWSSLYQQFGDSIDNAKLRLSIRTLIFRLFLTLQELKSLLGEGSILDIAAVLDPPLILFAKGGISKNKALRIIMEKYAENEKYTFAEPFSLWHCHYKINAKEYKFEKF